MNLQHELTRFAFLLIMSVSRTGFHTLLSALNFPRDRETIKMFSFFTLLTNAFKLSLCWRKTCPCMQPVAFCTPPMHTMGKCSQPATALQIESLRFFLNKQIPFLPGFGFFFLPEVHVCGKGGKTSWFSCYIKMSMIYTISIGSHIRWLPNLPSNNGFGFFVLDRTSGQGLQKNNDPSCINKFKDKRFWIWIPIGTRPSGDEHRERRAASTVRQ